MATKKKSAQAGNPNTLEPGFYSDQFSPDELALIAALVQDPTLDDELWAQRVVNRRLLAFISHPQGDKPVDLNNMIKVAEALARGTGRVARLLRDKRALSGAAANGIAGAIATALDELGSELGLEL